MWVHGVGEQDGWRGGVEVGGQGGGEGRMRG